jgi:beta-barrel assembly-enhancing protease
LQTYQAILIHPKISGGRCSGNLQINSGGVFFKSEEFEYVIPFKNLAINAGGAGNRFLFFKDKSQDVISIYTSDKSVLKNTFISSNPLFSKEIGQAKKATYKLVIASLVVIGFVVLFLGGLYLLKDKMVKGLASQVPIEWEQKAGDKLFSTMSLQYDFIKNDSLKKEFLKVGAPLFKQLEKKGYKIDLYFVKDASINAFALPGGKVIVQTGLIENAKSWEEVMGVLGHELAHVSQRHHIRGVINNIGIYAILSATVGDISALAGTFANIGGDLASLSNSRYFENEADETGWDYLVKAKINPDGLISFFETLKKENQTEIESTVKESVDLSFLSTHPDTQNRIDHLKKKRKNLTQKFEPLPNNFNNFKVAILKIK